MNKTLTLLILFVTFFSNAQDVNIPDPVFKAWLLTATDFNSVPVNTNGDGEIQVSEAEAVTSLEVNANTDNLAGLEAFINIEFFLCYSPVSTVNLNWFPHLKDFNGGANPTVTTVDVTGCTELKHLEIELMPVTNIIGLSTATALEYLDISEILVTSIDLTGLANLRKFICLNGHLTSITFPTPNQLCQTFLQNNPFTTIDITALHYVAPITIEEYPTVEFNGCQNLQYINAKNGLDGPLNEMSVTNCPSLQYICADESEFEYLAEPYAALGIQISPYCTFVPGGIYNTITGTIKIDADANGCDALDAAFAGMKVSINDGTDSGYNFTQANGSYSLFTGAGSFTVTPVLDNPYFTISPQSAVIEFAAADNSTQTADFCLVPNGIHQNLNVNIYPITSARPGFDVSYVIAYTNNGNQTQSGTVSLEFNDAILDFVTANPAASQSENVLTWDFNILQPFETRYIDFTLNVNSSLETPAVDINDVLVFNATVNPTETDETPDDNVFNFNQVVVGSFDPNDKTCVEGSSITPEMVGDYLHYIIRFQNSGTFYAENVVVRDIVDAEKFDIETLQLIGASHQQVTRIDGDKVEFIFEGINLPAEQDDEPGSHGYVAFKIKTKNTLVLGDSVENKADIFFDFNAPITTDPAVTTVEMLGVGEFENTSVSVSPNPVKNILTILAKDNISSIQVFDIQGRLLQTSLENQTNSSIDFTGKTSGIYFVKVITEKGIKVQKIIKQ